MIVDGNFIKRQRIKLGLSQRMVADEICHQSLISRLESTNHITSMTILLKICERLQISITDVTHGNYTELKPLKAVREALNKRQWHKAATILSNQRMRNALLPAAVAEYHLLCAKMQMAFLRDNEAIEALQLARTYLLPNSILLLAEIQAELACLYFKLGHEDRAEHFLKEATRKSNHLPKKQRDASREIVATIHFRLAQLQYNFKRYEAADKELEQAIERLAKNDTYHLMVDIQILKAKCAKQLKQHVQKQKALMLAYAAAEFSKDASLKEQVRPYFDY